MQSRFGTTSWTQVLAARTSSSPGWQQALEALCQTYWYPVYAFVRRQGHDADAARDLTQAYFAALLEKDYLGDYDPARGRFRVFLKTSVRHFLSKELEKARTWRRGGHTELETIHEEDFEGRYRNEPADGVTPEQILERRLALSMLECALGRLRDEHAEADRQAEFDQLKIFLTGELPKRSYREIAVELGTTEGAVKTSVHRLRQRFGTLLRGAIAETVADPDDVDDEVRYLLGVIAPWGAQGTQ